MIRALFVAFIAAGTLVATAPAARAVDKDVFKCEDANAKKSAKLAADIFKCIGKCTKRRQLGQDASAVCTDPPDPETQACVDKAAAKYTKVILQKCEGLIPACGEYAPFSPADTAGYAADQVAQNAPLTLSLVEPLAFCAPITDPKDKTQVATFKCEAKAAKSAIGFATSSIKCLGKCAKRRDQKGEVGLDCEITSPGLEAETVACIDGARAKAVAAIDKACIEKAGGFPDCGVYSGAVSGMQVTDFIDLQLQTSDPSEDYCAL